MRDLAVYKSASLDSPRGARTKDTTLTPRDGSVCELNPRGTVKGSLATAALEPAIIAVSHSSGLVVEQFSDLYISSRAR